MSEHQTMAPDVDERGPEPPPFDPDPALVADVEGNYFALRAFRKAAQSAHDEAQALR